MSGDIFDMIGVGFGPAGIALAAAIEDWVEANNGKQAWNIKFLEKNTDSTWQGSLLVPGTDTNSHHFRDFATPRNPRSQFTFANYLKEKGRLYQFAHLGGTVSRFEWSDYVIWTAEKLAQYVLYNQKVQDVSPYIEDGEVKFLWVKTDKSKFPTKSLVLSGGSKPHIPEIFRPYMSDTFFHTVQFLPKVSSFDKNSPLSFMLIGSGQSAGESLIYLRNNFQNGKFYSVHRSIGFKLLDSGHFSNVIYFPEETDYFFNLKPRQKKLAFQDIRLTNYSNIDWEVSKVLYWLMYEDKVQNNERIIMLNRRRVIDIEQKSKGYLVTLQDVYNGECIKVETDIVILGTGYEEDLFPSLLDKLRSFVQFDEEGGAHVSRDYRILTCDTFRPIIYLNGLSERTHGMSDAQSFSMMALRAEVIFRSWLLETKKYDSLPTALLNV
jgi:L-ornithine N5-oxygenase